MNWLERHSKALQALSAIVMAVVAVAALAGVKYQIDASYRVQREQSAKEIYREFLNISIANPDFAAPDYCALRRTPRRAAYEAYAEYLLYTAEQVIAMDGAWAATFDEQLKTHAAYICAEPDLIGYSDDVEALVKRFRTANCAAAPAC